MTFGTYFAIAVISSNACFAQSSSTLMGANIAGMGYASATIAGACAVFNNVAGLVHSDQLCMSYSYDVRPGLIGANRMAAAVSARSKIAAFSVGVFRFGDEVYNETQVSICAANEIDNTALGAKINYTQYWAETFGTITAASLDFGGITKITSQLSIGAYITNLTQSKQKETNGERLPTKLVAGLGFRPSHDVFVATEIEKDIDYKATWRSGIEYAIYEKAFFRTGFNINPAAAYFGFGAQKNKLKFDYAIRLSQLIDTTHQVSVVYVIRSKTKQ